jgi:hypothetical protein
VDNLAAMGVKKAPEGAFGAGLGGPVLEPVKLGSAVVDGTTKFGLVQLLIGRYEEIDNQSRGNRIGSKSRDQGQQPPPG